MYRKTKIFLFFNKVWNKLSTCVSAPWQGDVADSQQTPPHLEGVCWVWTAAAEVEDDVEKNISLRPQVKDNCCNRFWLMFKMFRIFDNI